MSLLIVRAAGGQQTTSKVYFKSALHPCMCCFNLQLQQNDNRYSFLPQRFWHQWVSSQFKCNYTDYYCTTPEFSVLKLLIKNVNVPLVVQITGGSLTYVLMIITNTNLLENDKSQDWIQSNKLDRSNSHSSCSLSFYILHPPPHTHTYKMVSSFLL